MNKNATRYYSKRQENSIAKAVGGKRQPNSGATKFAKGDVVTDDWLLEAKTKVKPCDSFSIKREWIDKNVEEAFSMGKQHSAVVFNFGDTHNPDNYYIISEEDFIEYLKLLNDKE